MARDFTIIQPTVSDLMLNECALAYYQDKIVETAYEVDLAMIFGTGFAPFRGGLLKYADSVGADYIAQQLQHYHEKTKALRLRPTEPLKALAAQKGKFYSK